MSFTHIMIVSPTDHRDPQDRLNQIHRALNIHISEVLFKKKKNSPYNKHD